MSQDKKPSKKIKIVYAGLREVYPGDRYNPQRGFTFEYSNFYLNLKRLPQYEVVEYPYDSIVEIGRIKFNERLLDLIRKEKPDVFLAFMYTDELDADILKKIKESGVVSIAWFADDYWRFFNYSRRWPPYFSWIVTTYSKAFEWYRAAGFENIIRSQWACDTSFYKPLDLPKDMDVSFVGQYKPPRGRVVEALEGEGVSVQAFGPGWPNGKVSQEKMIEVFSRSKINLNLNVRPGLFSPRVFARTFFRKSRNKIRPDFHVIDNLRAYLHFPIPHTHARPFELAGCRAFVISGLSEDIRDYYAEGKEMIFYSSTKDLIEKTAYYLRRDGERERIAEAGYSRTLRDHTYENRFREIFRTAGLL